MCDCDCDFDCDPDEEIAAPDQESIRESLEKLYAILAQIRADFPDADTSELEEQIKDLESQLNQDAPACVDFYSVVVVRWDSNTITVINNPANNGGFDFTGAQYQWYLNGRKIRGATGQSLTNNPDGGKLESGFYRVEISFSGGFLSACSEYVPFGVTI